MEDPKRVHDVIFRSWNNILGKPCKKDSGPLWGVSVYVHSVMEATTSVTISRRCLESVCVPRCCECYRGLWVDVFWVFACETFRELATSYFRNTIGWSRFIQDVQEPKTP